ncbi:7tm 6 domain containing protein, partial [Asbolus verrucosus]
CFNLTMEKFDWKRTIRINILLLKLVGLWPKGDEAYGRNFYTFYTFLSVVIFQIGHVFFQTVNLFLIANDLEAVTGTIFILLTDMGAFIKTYCLVKNMKMLKQLMITLNSDLFQPKNLEQRNLVQKSLNFWTIVVSIFWFCAFGCLFFWCSFPVFDKTVKEYRLPFLAWYPYNSKQSPQYELTYLYQAAAIIFTSMANVNTDTLIAALNVYIGAQFDILCDDLRNFNKGGKSSSEEVNQTLKNCIHHHREILKFAGCTNEFCNWLIFVQFFVGGISVGLTMFQLTVVVPFSSEFFSHVYYSTAVSVEAFMYCWFGNEIEIKSSKLPYAVFESDWIGLSPEIKKNVIIFVLRVQKSVRISALGLFYLSLETFVKVSTDHVFLEEIDNVLFVLDISN